MERKPNFLASLCGARGGAAEGGKGMTNISRLGHCVELALHTWRACLTVCTLLFQGNDQI